MRKSFIHIMAVLAIALALASCSSDDSSSNKTETTVALRPAKPPRVKEASPNQGVTLADPLVASVTADDVDGTSRALTEWLGKKPVVINFWGTWCPPCRREIPGLVQLYGEYKERGVEIVSLAIERSAGPLEVRAFGEQAGMKWVMLMSNDDVARAFRLGQSVPTTIFFDAQGNEVARHVGARSYNDFKKEFEKIAGT